MKSIKCFQIVSSECHSTERGSSIVFYFRIEKKKKERDNQLRKDQLLEKFQHDHSQLLGAVLSGRGKN